MTSLPEQTSGDLAEEVLEKHYGPGSVWEEPNRHGESGFSRAQAESDISWDEIAGLIAEAVELDRKRRADDGTADAACTDPSSAPGTPGTGQPADEQFTRFGKAVAGTLGTRIEWGSDELSDIDMLAYTNLGRALGDQDVNDLLFWQATADEAGVQYDASLTAADGTES